MRKLLVAAALLATAAAPAFAQGLGERIPPWATDAVQAVRDKRIMEGYPDGKFHGERPVTIRELEIISERILAADRAEHGQAVTAADRARIHADVERMIKELPPLRRRIDGIEKRVHGRK